MPQDPSGRKSGHRPLSAAAQADIADRVAAARPYHLAELTAVARARGRVTNAELAATVDLLAHLTHPDDLPRALGEWLASVGADPARAIAWLVSDAGVDLTLRTRADHDDHLVGMRRPADDKTLRRVWDINPEEEEALGLEHLVGEARRSMLRRRAEGARPVTELRAEQAAARADKPPADPSAARAARRRAAIEAEQEAIKDVYDAACVPPPHRRGSKPWEAAGVSKSTWDRQQRDANRVRGHDLTAGQVRTDYPGLPTTLFLYYKNYRVAPADRNRVTRTAVAWDDPPGTANRSAAPPPRPAQSAPPSPSACPYAEGRRLLALGRELGLAWLGSGEDPVLWWVQPPAGHPGRARYDAAVEAACHGRWRHEHESASKARAAATETEEKRLAPALGNLAGRHREAAAAEIRLEETARRHTNETLREAAEAVLWSQAIGLPFTVADPDGAAEVSSAAAEMLAAASECPVRIRVAPAAAAWDAALRLVPKELLPRLTRHVGAAFLAHLEPALAVAAGVAAVLREAAILRGVVAARPAAVRRGPDIHHVAHLARPHLSRATSDAVAAVVAALDAEAERYAAALEQAERAAEGLILPNDPEQRARILASAARLLAGDRPPTLAAALDLARQREQW
ncbi:hypothetical protein [Azospirillum endophyticum]